MKNLSYKMLRAQTMLYLDHASTSSTIKEVLTTYEKLNQTQFVNSESSYDLGVQVHQQLEKSRQLLADFLSVKPNDLIFTSGASESNSLAIIGTALANKDKGKHLITSLIEHSSVLNAFNQLERLFDFEVTYLPVDKNGMVNLDKLKESLRQDTILVSIMHVNNEIGVIQPIKEISKIVHEYSNALFHCDCVQSFLKEEVDFSYFDLASISFHKIGGLKGSGLLYKKAHLTIEPLIHGGQQEFGIRGGTLDAHRAIVSAKTVRLASEFFQKNKENIYELKQYLVKEISTIQNLTIHAKDCSSNYILSFSLIDYSSEFVFNVLQKNNIYVSYRSTCHSRDKNHSHVLQAIGCSEKMMQSVIRISWDYSLTKTDIDYFIQKLKEVYSYEPNL